MKRLVRVCLVLAVVFRAGAGGAQTLSPQGVAEIETILQRAVAQGVVPGVVAIVANKDRILYHGTAGLQDVRNQRPMAKDAIFRIASMTKPVTSAAVMMLVEQGRIKVDDPISKYLPAYQGREVLATFNAADGTYTTRPGREVLIRHLLTNTSGFAYGFSNVTVNQLQQKTGKQPEDLPLLYEPGTEWTYSGSTKILGQLVERIAGASLDAVFTERFFTPLGMADTAYSVPPGKISRVVTTHRRQNGMLVETPNPEKIASPVAGDGGLHSTAEDYVKFLQMLLNEGRLGGRTYLSKNSVRDMTKNQIGNVIVQTQPAANPGLTNPFPIGAGRDKFGFGFQIATSNRENRFLREPGSYTWAGIYNTHFWVDPKRKIAAVIMMQTLPFYDEPSMKLYQEVEAAIGRHLR